MVTGLKELVDLDRNDPNKVLRASQIGESERKVQNDMSTITDFFISPFDQDIPRDKLINIVSGKPVSDDIAKCLLEANERGEKQVKSFRTRLTDEESTLKPLIPSRRYLGPHLRTPVEK